VRLAAPDLARAPLNSAESGVAEEVVGECDGLHRLMPVAHARDARIAARYHVIQTEGVRTIHAHGQPHIAAKDRLVSKLLRIGRHAGAEADDPVLARLRLEHRPITDDEAETDERLRDHAVAVVARPERGCLRDPGRVVRPSSIRARRAEEDELADALKSLDDYSRDELLIPTKYLDGSDRIVQLYKEAGGTDLPTPETAEKAASDGAIVQCLLALEEYVSYRLDSFTSWRGFDTPVDKGGNTNLLKERYGPPAWWMVRHAWIVFENCRPGQAKSTEDSPFHRFVNHIYEYATGETEENSTLLNWIKKLARALRYHDALLQQLGPLEVELDDLKLDPPTPERDARISQLEAELPALRQRVVDAFIALGHSNYRQKA